MSYFDILDDINNNIVINSKKEESCSYKFLFFIYLLITMIYIYAFKLF
jgi:hypothetical protein